MASLQVTLSLKDLFSSGLTRCQKSLQSFKQSAQNATNSLKNISGGASSANSSFSTVNSTVGKTQSAFSKLISTTKTLISVVGGLTIIRNIFNLIGSSIQGALDRIDTMDTFRRKMELITGDSKNAEYALEQLKDSTTGTAYALDTATKSVQNFVTRGMDTKAAVKSTNIWMDVVAAYGKGTNEEFETVTDAIAKMRTKGTVEMKQLNRLFQVGVNPVQAYAKAIGSTQEEVQEMLSNKSIRADEFLSVVEEAYSTGLNGVTNVSGMAKKAGTTWAGTIANMKIAITRGMVDVITAVDDSFKVLNDRGLKGIVAGFGRGLEKGMSGFSVVLGGSLLGLFTVFRQIKDGFSTTTGEVGKSIKEMNNSFDSFKINIKVMKSRVSDSLRETGRIIRKDIVPNLVLASANFATMGAQSLSALTPLVDILVKIGNASLETVGGAISDFAVRISELGKTEVPKFIREIVKIFDRIKDEVMPAVNERMKRFIDFVGEMAELVVPPFLQFIVDLFNRWVDLLVACQPYYDKVQDFLTELAKAVVPHALEVIQKFFEKCVEVSAELQPLFTAVLDFFTDIASVVLPPIINGLLDFFEWMIDNGDTLIPIILGVGAALKVFSVLKTISELGWVVTVLQGIGVAIEYIGTAAVGALTAITAHPIVALIALVAGLIVWLVSLYQTNEDFRDKVNAVWSAIVSAVSWAVDGLVGFFTVVIPNAYNFVVDTLKGWGDNIRDFFAPSVEFIQGIGQAWSEGWDSAVQGVQDFKDSIVQKWNDFTTWLSDSVDKIKEVWYVICRVAGYLKDKVMEKLQPMFDWCQDKWDGFVSAMETAGQNVKTHWDNFVTGLDQNLVQPAKQKYQEFKDGMSELGQAISDVWEDCKQEAVNKWDQFLDGVDEKLVRPTKERWDNLVADTQNCWETFKDNVGTAVDNVNTHWDNFTSFLDERLVTPVKEKFTEFVDSVISWKDNVINKAEELWNGISPHIDNIKNDFQSLKDNVSEHLGGVWQALVDAYEQLTDPSTDIEQIFSDMGLQIDEHLTSAYNAIVQFGTDAWNELINIKNQLVQAGKDLIQGFFDGVSEKWNAGVDTVKGFFASLVPGVKEEYDINSPSRVAYGIGEYFVEGFSNAFSDLMPGVNSEVYSLFGAVSKQATSQAYRAGSGISSGLNSGMNGTIAGPSVAMSTANFDTPQSSVVDTNDQLLSTNYLQLLKLSSDTIGIYGNMNSSVVSQTVENGDQVANILTSNSTEWLKINTSLAISTVALYEQLDRDIITTLNLLPPSFFSIGVQMMKSLTSGIVSQKNSVLDATHALVEQMKKVFTDALGIHSPSDYMIWIAEMMGLGILKGFNTDQILQFFDAVVGDMKTSFANGTFDPYQLVNYLGNDATLKLIGKLSEMDMGEFATASLVYPVQGQPFVLNAPFHENRGDHFHAGVDLMAPMSNPILAALPGIVTYSGGAGGTGYGNHVILDHGGGIETVYAHFMSNSVSAGQSVTAGQQIGLADSTGNSTGSHLHFEYYMNGVEQDPTGMLGGASVAIGNPLVQAIQAAYNSINGIVGSSTLGGSVPYDATQGVSQWSSTVLQALSIVGQPASYLNDVLWAILNESGGNPNAINDWDSNAAMGDPSRGLEIAPIYSDINLKPREFRENPNVESRAIRSQAYENRKVQRLSKARLMRKLVEYISSEMEVRGIS